MNKKSIFDSAEETVKKYNMIEKGNSVLIALSGGADSVFLLLFMLNISKKYNLKLRCAHVEHGIRGQESIDDCIFCRNLCEKNNVEFSFLSIDAPKEAYENKMGVEEYSRKKRYEFFDSFECDKIATAHTLSDNAETVIFHLIRGTALKGAAGIPPVRGKIIRPLIETGGREIRQWLKDNNIEYRIDKTNFDSQYSRNHIRNDIMPLFSDINSEYEASILRFTQYVSEDEKLLEKIADDAYKKTAAGESIKRKNLKDCPKTIRTRVIAKFISENGAKANSFNISSVENLLYKSSRFQLGNGLYAVSSGDSLRISHICDEKKDTEFVCQREIVNYTDFLNNCKLYGKHFDFCCDYDKIAGVINVRHRQKGDSIAPYGRGCRKTLKKLFNEMHIPVEEREKIAVVADEIGVIGIADICTDERVVVDSQTKNVLILDIRAED